MRVASLNSEIEALTSKLQLQADRSSELQSSLNDYQNDNEILKLTLQDAEQQREQLEVEKHQVTDELGQQVEQLSSALQSSEEQRQQLETEKDKVTSELGGRIEELTTALQASEEQHTRISQEFSELIHKVDGMSGALRAAQEHHAQLEARNNKTKSEFALRIKELSTALHTAEEQRQELAERANKVEKLSGQSHELASEVEQLKAALQESIEQRQTLENQAHKADKLAAENAGLNDEIEHLNSELQAQANRASELTQRSNEFTSDNESLRLSLEEKDRLLQQLDAQFSELEAGHSQATSDLTHRIEELSAALSAAEEHSQKLGAHASQADQFSDQNSELQQEVERLAAALQDADQQREALELRASQADELNNRVEELTAALQHAQEQSQQLGEQASQSDQFSHQNSELQHEVERLTASLEFTEQQRAALEQRASQADELIKRVEQLSDELHTSEEQRQQLAGHNMQAEAANSQITELKNEIERLTKALQLARSQTVTAAGESDNSDAVIIEALQEEPAPAAENMLSGATAIHKYSQQPATDEAGTHTPENIIADPNEQDSLTGLLNRQGFLRELEQAIREFPATGKDQAVMYLLLDNFSSIREKTGVAASDGVIAEVSRLISENCQASDTIARFGDSVFTILHYDEGISSIQAQAEKLLHAIEGFATEINGQAVMTTASIGICVINDYTVDPQNILNRADLACEVARSSGGNQLQIHSTIIDEQLSDENMDDWNILIRKTLEEQRFYLVYQPIICLGEDQNKRYEVLLRIVDEDGQIILPGKFISLAENLGLSREIDMWVIDTALKKLAENNNNNTLFFIKLSASALQDSGLPRWIHEKLAAYSLNSGNVVFEIPEEIAINNLKHTMLFTKAMRSLGCKFALEHYAATTQPQLLKHIQIDHLKIDGTLISSLGTNDESRTAVRAIIDRARQYNLKAVAEHVDSAASLALLWELGADFAQGNFIQEPSKEIDYDFFGEIETHDIPGAPDYNQTRAPEKVLV